MSRSRQVALYGAIALGGAAGTLARAGLLEAWPVRAGAWPWTTFAVNLAGAFVLGAVATHLHDRASLGRPLLGTGFCGALTTFSTLELEVLRLGRGHAVGLAAGYLVASVVAGFAAVLAGSAVARRASR